MTLIRPLFLSLLVWLVATAAEAQSAAERIFLNAAVWTGRSDGVDATAFAIRGGEIIAVGTDRDMAAVTGPETELVDLGGAFVVPGFIDNHVHFADGSFALVQVQLRDAATPQEFSGRIADAAAQTVPGGWVLGGNWDHELWGGELPDRAWIDEATGGVPVSVVRLDGHMVLANSAALKLAGIDATTPDPEGGLIVRDGTGRPTGVLKDEAMFLLDRVIPKPSDAQMEAAFRRGMAHAAKMGLTQVHDMGYDWRSLEAFKRLQDKGALTIRVQAFTPLADWRRMAAYVAANGRGDDWLGWGGMKGFADGSLGSTTAWFYGPYADAPETNGFPLLDMRELKIRVAGAAGVELPVAVHAIGDQANDRVLDIFDQVSEALALGSPRFRIEHAQHLTGAAIPRFRQLGVIASMHPYHLIDDGRWAEKRLGRERLAGTYAIGSLMAAGARVTFGSDWPVAPLDPIMGIYAAVTRRTLDGKNPAGWVPEQKISVLQALQAYTVNNAYAGFQEKRIGKLMPGYQADFVVLNANLFAIDPASIKDVKVHRTTIGGVDRFVAK